MNGGRWIRAGVGVLALLPILWIPTGGVEQAEGSAFCSIHSPSAPIRNGEPHTLLRVYALADTLITSGAPREEWSRFRDEAEGDPSVAQLFKVLEVHGPNERGLAVGDTVAVVPWGYLADCSTSRWHDSAQWVAPGSEGVFSFPVSAVRGDPTTTVDVAGWHNPYPQARFLRAYREEGAPEDREEWLTPSEMFELLAVLPEVHWRDTHPDSVMPEIRRIFEVNQRFRETFPGTRFLQQYERWAGRNR